MTLNEFFAGTPRAALGFSGGVDSAYLLWAGLQAGAEIRPYFVKTPFQPDHELADAKKLTAALGVSLKVISLDVLSVQNVGENPENRCYFCKKALFSEARAQAAAEGYHLLLDGTNASDEVSDRPGFRALQELAVRSPLRECGLTKAEIRRRAKAAGLFVWDKPAYACLATRVPAGQPITKALLARIEGAEEALFSLGFRDFRVRVFHDTARLQVQKTELERAAREAGTIREKLRPYFDTVLLDLKGR